MGASAAVTATLEDYLEAILGLVGDRGEARVNEIADAVSVHKSTVTAALKRLATDRLVAHRPYGTVVLTPAGRRTAERVARRHELIRAFLVDALALDKDVAETNACRMEHVLDPEVFDRLRLFARFLKKCPRCGCDPTPAFRDFCSEQR